MNFRATSTFKPVDVVRLQRLLLPKIVAAVSESCGAVVDEAKILVPVGNTGELKDSIHTSSVEIVGSQVSGKVVADAPHAGFVEFGTGIVGDGTYPYDLPETGVPLTGSWVYDYKKQNWQGHEAQPFMRPALDIARPGIISAFARRGFKI